MNIYRRYSSWILFALILIVVVSWAPRGHADAPSGRYDTSMTDTVYDTKTLLTWQRVPDATARAWSGAQMYCSGLNLDNKLDWRLPSLKELQTIVDEQRKLPALDTSAFTTGQYAIWTSSEVAGTSAAQAWIVNFSYGDSQRTNVSTAMHYARCVR